MKKRRTLEAAIKELCRERGEKITLKQMVEFYGRAEAAEMVAKAVVRTIIETQRKMRAGKFGYSVTPKDIIPGRLEWAEHPPLLIIDRQPNADGSLNARYLFNKQEIEYMRKTIPSFDRLFNVRREVYAEED